MPPQRRYGRTALEKWQTCQARQIQGQRPGEMKLEEFCKLFPNREGNAMPVSTMCTILKQSDRLLMSGKAPEGASAVKMKHQPDLFPIFERLLAEWIEKATYAKVLISDEVSKEQGRNLIIELDQRVNIADIQDFEEDYTGLELSNGWLGGFKTRNGLVKQRFAGDASSTDPALVEPGRQNLRIALANHSLRDVYNVDETAFQ